MAKQYWMKNRQTPTTNKKGLQKRGKEAGTIYTKAFFAATVDAMAHNVKQNKVPKPGDVKSKGSVMSRGTRWGAATPTTMPRRKLP